MFANKRATYTIKRDNSKCTFVRIMPLFLFRLFDHYQALKSRALARACGALVLRTLGSFTCSVNFAEDFIKRMVNLLRLLKVPRCFRSHDLEFQNGSHLYIDELTSRYTYRIVGDVTNWCNTLRGGGCVFSYLFVRAL